MWTPKRILLLTLGFFAFSVAYATYAHFLGGIDGLRQLPDEYQPSFSRDRDALPPPPPESRTVIKLRQAFGDACSEVNACKIKCELQNGLVLATQDFVIERDGQVRLTPFILAIFGKPRGDNYPEINTVRCKEALIRFDKPIANIFEMDKRKIVGGTLKDKIYIFNNRGTPQRDDDICLFTEGPLDYEESRHLVWTENIVWVTDPQSRPKPITISGKGMDLYLTDDTTPGTSPQSQGHRPRAEGPSRLDRIELRQDVDMNLWVDSHSGLLGAGKNSPERKSTEERQPQGTGNSATAQQPAPEEKAKVVIRTPGPFRYDLRTNRATFDILPKPGLSNEVTVDRVDAADESKIDHLKCDHLELQFRRDNQTGAKEARDKRPEGLEIESAHATGEQVVLTSEADLLAAYGSDFFYDKLAHRSTLKGKPRMYAIKEGNEIEAPELQLVDVKGAQQATAVGAGTIRMFDKDRPLPDAKRPLEAHWKQKLVYAKDGPYDLLTLVGDAFFLSHDADKEGQTHDQQLRANLLKAWLEPPDRNLPADSDPQRRRLHHVEGVGHVSAISSDLQVHDTDHLVIRFKDVSPAGSPAPVTVSPQPKMPEVHVANKPGEPSASLLPRETDGSQLAPRETDGGHLPPLRTTPSPATPARPKKPIDLSARLVEVDAVRTGSKTDLDKLWCEGAVRVHQEPQTPEDKGVDIRGESLLLTHHPDGNVLEVTGDYGQVQLNKVFILGPKVYIDQTANQAWVRGLGIMRMLSSANFDGSTLTRPQELTVNWDEGMLFDGQLAQFWGNVRADQDSGHLTCREMQVVLDHKISLREGEKSSQPAKVQKLLCDRNVWIEDSKRDGARLISYKRLECSGLDVDNDTEKDESQAWTTGPGTVRIFQLGTKGEILPAAPGVSNPQTAAPVPRGGNRSSSSVSKAEEEFKLTHISYLGRMYANNKLGMATFRDNVVVVHLPTDQPDLKIDSDRPPPESMRLSCETLEVLTHKLPDGKTTSQEMKAHHKVFIEGQGYYGHAEDATYDESKGQVILQGKPGNLAVLYQEKGKAAEAKEIKARTIFYYPRTGDFQGEGSLLIRVIK